MIYGNIDNIEQYRNDIKLYAAFTALKNYINGDSYDENSITRFNSQECNVCKLEDAKLENHHKYIDIHYVVRGAERILVSPDINNLERLKEFSEESDCELFALSGTEESFELHEGDFLVVYPGEAHAAKLAVGNTATSISKVVVKLQQY